MPDSNLSEADPWGIPDESSDDSATSDDSSAPDSGVDPLPSDPVEPVNEEPGDAGNGGASNDEPGNDVPGTEEGPAGDGLDDHDLADHRDGSDARETDPETAGPTKMSGDLASLESLAQVAALTDETAAPTDIENEPVGRDDEQLFDGPGATSMLDLGEESPGSLDDALELALGETVAAVPSTDDEDTLHADQLPGSDEIDTLSDALLVEADHSDDEGGDVAPREVSASDAMAAGENTAPAAPVSPLQSMLAGAVADINGPSDTDTASNVESFEPQPSGDDVDPTPAAEETERPTRRSSGLSRMLAAAQSVFGDTEAQEGAAPRLAEEELPDELPPWAVSDDATGDVFPAFVSARTAETPGEPADLPSDDSSVAQGPEDAPDDSASEDATLSAAEPNVEDEVARALTQLGGDNDEDAVEIVSPDPGEPSDETSEPYSLDDGAADTPSPFDLSTSSPLIEFGAQSDDEPTIDPPSTDPPSADPIVLIDDFGQEEGKEEEPTTENKAEPESQLDAVTIEDALAQEVSDFTLGEAVPADPELSEAPTDHLEDDASPGQDSPAEPLEDPWASLSESADIGDVGDVGDIDGMDTHETEDVETDTAETEDVLLSDLATENFDEDDNAHENDPMNAPLSTLPVPAVYKELEELPPQPSEGPGFSLADVASTSDAHWGERWEESAQGWIETPDGSTAWRPIVTTSETLESWSVETYLGVVTGDSSVDAGDTDSLSAARTDALEKAIAAAIMRGAHAVTSVSFQVQTFADTAIVTASGTAVTLRSVG